MTMYKLIVWTRFDAAAERVAALVADPTELAESLPRGMRWELSDPEGLRRARMAGEAATHTTRVRTPLGVVDWPVDLEAGPGPLRFTERSDNAWFGTWVHRHRIERAIGGRVRVVDELVLAPRTVAGGLVVRAVARLLARSHGHLADQLGTPACEPTSTRVYRLGPGNLGHVEGMLDRLPGA